MKVLSLVITTLAKFVKLNGHKIRIYVQEHQIFGGVTIEGNTKGEQ